MEQERVAALLDELERWVRKLLAEERGRALGEELAAVLDQRRQRDVPDGQEPVADRRILTQAIGFLAAQAFEETRDDLRAFLRLIRSSTGSPSYTRPLEDVRIRRDEGDEGYSLMARLQPLDEEARELRAWVEGIVPDEREEFAPDDTPDDTPDKGSDDTPGGRRP